MLPAPEHHTGRDRRLLMRTPGGTGATEPYTVPGFGTVTPARLNADGPR
ncbi:hypothetical protein EES46_31935 [Streptomyces sp. ADI98-10]|nr:hypothetical protein EES46_31935 [Streptomyces sp. ADI98-10]